MPLDKLRKFILTIFVMFFVVNFSFADTKISNADTEKDKNLPKAASIEKSENTSYLKEVAFSSGYAQGKLADFKRYKLVPMSVRFGFDLDPFLAKFNFKPKGITEIIWEPFINTVVEPNNNIETGLNWLLKYAYPLTERFYPYLAFGAGVVYLSQHTREQGTQFNFTEQLEGGLSYFVKKNVALNIGIGFRHLSNSSIKRPNSGINTKSVVGGVSFFF